MDFHASTVEDAARELGTDLKHGLGADEAAARLSSHGPNELPVEKRRSLVILFLRQFHNALTYILFAAAAISVFAGEPNDAYGIAIAISIKAIVGFVQERRAEMAIERLRDLVVQEATVVRGGRVRRIPAREVVPGDVLVVNEGDRVAADARLIECRDVNADESSLTGESLMSRKAIDPVPAEALLPDRRDMIWMGTSIVTGGGRGVVVETGGRTAFGRIATSLVSIRRETTPLEKRFDRLGRQLGLLAVTISAAILVLGSSRGIPIVDMFFFAVALMVSVVPEGLPAVLAVVLAIGVQRMARRNAIVRHVPSVETLGVADVICTDKTGTLTENKMTVREIVASSYRIVVTGEGWDPKGEFLLHDRAFHPSELPETDLLLRAAATCNKSAIEWRGDSPTVIGDPTEGALVVLAAKAGFDKVDLEKEYALIDEVTFSSERKFRAMLLEHRDIHGHRSRLVFTVGAYGVVRDRSAEFMTDGRHHPLDAEARVAFDGANQEMAGRALRVLGVAFKRVNADVGTLKDGDVAGLTFLGLIGMIDPPRVGVTKALERCRLAGVRVIMITGDQKATAVAIGREIGLLPENADPTRTVFTEKEIASLDEERFMEILKEATIFARVTPETKLRIVGGLQAMGHTVAMTGDGVNDAPALKKASIGVSMGISGTDVSKEVADMVLADDNFVSIVNAIEEGRIVFRNVKQTTAYLFMTNIGEVVTIVTSLLIGLPLPLLPAQILWMNLVTDGFPDVALSTEPTSSDVLAQPPRRREAPIITKNILLLTLMTSALMCAGTLWLFTRALEDGGLGHARTVAFTAMVLFQLWNVFNMRSATASMFSLGLRSNPYVLLAVGLSLTLQLSILYVPGLRKIFETQPLAAAEWLSIAVVAGSVFVLVEFYKLLIRRRVIPRSWL